MPVCKKACEHFACIRVCSRWDGRLERGDCIHHLLLRLVYKSLLFMIESEACQEKNRLYFAGVLNHLDAIFIRQS